MSVFDDTFLRDDQSPVSTPYVGSVDGTLRLTSHTLVGTGSYQAALIPTSSPDATVEATVTLNSGGIATLLARLNSGLSPGNECLYFSALDSNTWQFYEYNGGAVQQSASGSATTGTGSVVLKMVMSGTTADLYVNGSLVATKTVLAHASGTYHGVRIEPSTSPQFTRLTITGSGLPGVPVGGPVATVATSAPAGTVGAPPTVVTGPVATVAVDALPGLVRIGQSFTAYDLDANASQAMQVPVELSGFLETNPIPVPPPTHWVEAQVRARRLSLVMPDPALDSRGRPT